VLYRCQRAARLEELDQKRQIEMWRDPVVQEALKALGRR
jgi:hypothetical protein